jgi:hypothetical protein
MRQLFVRHSGEAAAWAKVAQLPESWNSKIWPSVQRDSEPRMTVLARAGNSLPDSATTKQRVRVDVVDWEDLELFVECAEWWKLRVMSFQ